MIQRCLSPRGMMARRRPLLSKVSLGLGGLALGCGYAWLNRTASAAATSGPSGSHEAAGRPLAGAALASKAPVFPLKVAPGKRHLVDAAGEPFMIHGDTAWSLIAELTREEVDLYLDDRRDRGFNTILVNLIEHAFASNAPANAYGEPPFLEPGDYTTPNEAYFAHADWILRQAADRGILVLLSPSNLGWRGGSSGWYELMVANGPDRVRAYGEYLGRRYRDFSNILWMHGGDYDPPERTLVRAIVQGIRTHDHR